MKNTKRVKRGKKFFSVALFLFLTAGLVAPAGFSRAKTIDVDGSFSDWDDVATLVDEGGFSGSSSEFSADGTTYYFNTATDSWQTTEISGACKVNYDYMLSVDFLKMTNDNNYLYLLWERGTDFMDFRWEDGNYYVYSSSVPTSAPNGEFAGTPPCAGHAITAPIAFDHDMVISVDKDKDGDYDYYLVVNIQYPAGWDFSSSYDTTGYILEDNGNGAYDGISSENMKTTFGGAGFEIGISAASHVGVRQEWKMSVDQIFTDLGLDWGDSVNVRYEAHSLNPSDTTPVEAFTFAKDKALKLKVNNKKRTRKSSIRINGKTARGATVEISVNGEDQGTVSVSRGGTFHKRVNLAMGANSIRVDASHATKGTKNVAKTVTRRR